MIWCGVCGVLSVLCLHDLPCAVSGTGVSAEGRGVVVVVVVVRVFDTCSGGVVGGFGGRVA